MKVKWYCESCGAINFDYTEATAFPLCSECNNSPDWEDIHTQLTTMYLQED